MFLKRERATNAEKEHETIKSLESVQDKSQSCLQELRRTLDLAKEHQKRLKDEAEEKETLETILKRDWILRKLMPNGDERRFCEPCMKWYRAVGHGLRNLKRTSRSTGVKFLILILDIYS